MANSSLKIILEGNYNCKDLSFRESFNPEGSFEKVYNLSASNGEVKIDASYIGQSTNGKKMIIILPENVSATLKMINNLTIVNQLSFRKEIIFNFDLQYWNNLTELYISTSSVITIPIDVRIYSLGGLQ